MSNATFDYGVKQYTKKFNGIMDDLSAKSMEAAAKRYGMSADDLKAGLESNSPDFRKFCLAYASTLMPGRVSCCTYAAVVARVAKQFGVPFKVWSGCCLQKGRPSYAKDVAAWKTRHEAGEEHPFMATHVFTEINGVNYEYFNGDTSDIDHLDVVVIAEG